MLNDMRILDFTHVYFGPYATMILGDMGADVIKIEPPWGEVARLYAPLYGGMSSVFLYLDRSKRGMSLNLKNIKAVEIAKALAEKTMIAADAEAYKIFAEYKATADGIQAIRDSLTGDYLTYEMLNQWDGTLPVIIGDDGSLFLDVRALIKEPN